MDELEMLEKLEYTEPCERARLQFENNGNRRYMALSDLKAPKGHCVWCDAVLKGKQRRWCSISCVNAASHRATPQSPSAKIYRLIHLQNFACKSCGLSFEEQIRKDIRDRYERMNRIIQEHEKNSWNSSGGRLATDPEIKVSYYWIGSNTGHIHQTDHIIPVHKGGDGINPANLQTICVPCHNEKSIKDRRKTAST